MKEKEKYRLDEAIKNFYTIQPLKGDLARMVSEKVFAKTKKIPIVSDRWWYVSAVILLGVFGLYSIRLLNGISLPLLSLIVFTIACLIGLARKEYVLFSHKLKQMSMSPEA